MENKKHRKVLYFNYYHIFFSWNKIKIKFSPFRGDLVRLEGGGDLTEVRAPFFSTGVWAPKISLPKFEAPKLPYLQEFGLPKFFSAFWDHKFW